MYAYAILSCQGEHWKIRDGQEGVNSQWPEPVQALNELSRQHWDLVGTFEMAAAGSAHATPNFLLRRDAALKWDLE